MRIFGITIPENKQVQYGLTVIYGIGLSRAREILERADVRPEVKVRDLTPEDQKKIMNVVSEYTLEGDLRRKVSQDIKRLIDIGSYRGMRHVRRLPVRGQRTKTNNRTRRGNKRVTMGSGKIKASKK